MGEDNVVSMKRILPVVISAFLPYGLWLYQTYGGTSLWLGFNLIAGIFLYRLDSLGEPSPMIHFFVGGNSPDVIENFVPDWLFGAVPFLIINVLLILLLAMIWKGRAFEKGVIALAAISFIYSGFILFFRNVIPIPLTAILALALMSANKPSIEHEPPIEKPPVETGPSVSEASDIPTANCPDCGTIVKLAAGALKPDGSVVCTKCLKKFVP